MLQASSGCGGSVTGGGTCGPVLTPAISAINSYKSKFTDFTKVRKIRAAFAYGGGSCGPPYAGVRSWSGSGWYKPSRARGALFGLGLLILLRGPEREVVAEQLHDEGGVLVALLVERVELGDGIVEGLVG